ncbi:hypothetical protein [Arthrobacter sp.]|uniref:hypothetical protein n=1 Tax=Arthrobacter sp. TaxID=1667 RepID=UPI003A8E0E31
MATVYETLACHCHAHAFREGNTRSQTVFFEQLARDAGWSLDVARLSPHHPQSVYDAFVAARFEHQRLRGSAGNGPAEAASSPQASWQLADVLHGLVEPVGSSEGRQRRGEAEPGVETGHVAVQDAREVQVAGPKARHARHPELRGMKLDPYGLADEPVTSAGGDYQP